MTHHHEIICRHSRPLDPRATMVEPCLSQIAGLKAVLFDVYGTMLVSASGEVGTADAAGRTTALCDSLAAAGLTMDSPPSDIVDQLHDTIRSRHEDGRKVGIEYPEVDIVEVWMELLSRVAGPWKAGDVSKEVVQQLAIEYECRVNPVWPMPGLESCLAELNAAGFVLGIVSNAQFFTPELFPALLHKTLEDLGFSRSFQFFSFEHSHAKPGLYLYQLARQTLESGGINADEVLYIGNDMLNDIMPAQQLGFRTALFAGDERSLRMRESDERIRRVRPDLVVTALTQLTDCIVMS